VGSLNSIELDGFNYESVFTGFESNKKAPDRIVLNQNYPNPFSGSTTLTWQLPKDDHIVLKVYDFSGREVKSLLDCEMAKGEHQITFNATGLPLGVYFYQIKVGGYTQTKKMIIIE